MLPETLTEEKRLHPAQKAPLGEVFSGGRGTFIILLLVALQQSSQQPTLHEHADDAHVREGVSDLSLCVMKVVTAEEREEQMDGREARGGEQIRDRAGFMGDFD